MNLVTDDRARSAHVWVCALGALGALGAAGCSRAERPPAAHVDSGTTAASAAAAPMRSTGDTIARCTGAGDSLCFHAERTYDFARDGRPFTIVVDARGPAADSLRVALRITRGDTVFHRADWSTALYGAYDERPVSRDSARRRATARLASLLVDSAFRPTRALLGGASDPMRMLRETIAFDVAVDAERRRRGLTPADTLPTTAAQSPAAAPDPARVRALAAELLDAPAFRYYAGGEATYAVAWSRAERRFVVVFACC